MKAADFFHDIVDPSLKKLTEWTGVPSDDRARVLTMATAGQESGWTHRRQVGIGQYHPQTVGARGYWQFESTWGGPVALNDVMQKAPQGLALVCGHLEIPADELSLYEAIAWNDRLACCLARLLLWVDPRPLPAVGDHDTAWYYYLRCWNPGAPRPGDWAQNYAIAKALVEGREP